MSKAFDFEFRGRRVGDVFTFDDTLGLVGFGLGVMLVLIGIATILGQPWTIKDTAPAAIQILGSIGTSAIGVALLWLTSS